MHYVSSGLAHIQYANFPLSFILFSNRCQNVLVIVFLWFYIYSAPFTHKFIFLVVIFFLEQDTLLYVIEGTLGKVFFVFVNWEDMAESEMSFSSIELEDHHPGTIL